MTKFLFASWLLACAVGAGAGSVSAQQIRGRYVQQAQEDGTIYHTLPCTLFEHPQAGDLTFDITYKERKDGEATLNFTCMSDETAQADSVRFDAGHTEFGGPVRRLYIEPERKRWKHRYSLGIPVAALGTFFDEAADPTVTLHFGGQRTVYRVKRAAWRSYAPVGNRIFETIRLNERP